MVLALKVGATLLALVLVSRLVDPRLLFERVRATNPLVFGAAVFLSIWQIPLVALRWRLIVTAMNREGGVVPRWLKFFQITYVSVFFGQVLPFVAGDGLRIMMLREAGSSLRIAFKSTLLDRGAAALALFILGLPAVLFSPVLASAHVFLRPAVLMIAMGLVGAGGLIVGAKVLHRFGRRWRVVGAVTETLVDLHDIVFGLAYGPAVFGLCFLVHGLSILVFWLLAHGQGLQLSLMDAIAVVPLILLVSMLPIAIGGWGVREGFVIALLGAGGVSHEDALVLSLSFGTVVLLASLPGLAMLAAPTWLPASRRRAVSEGTAC